MLRADGMTRTCNLPVNSRMLCWLSYVDIHAPQGRLLRNVVITSHLQDVLDIWSWFATDSGNRREANISSFFLRQMFPRCGVFFDVFFLNLLTGIIEIKWPINSITVVCFPERNFSTCHFPTDRNVCGFPNLELFSLSFQIYLPCRSLSARACLSRQDMFECLVCYTIIFTVMDHRTTLSWYPFHGSRYSDSNRKPADYKSATLPIEPYRQMM